MSAEDNLKQVHAIYDAFGRGDLPTILGVLADDVEWNFQGPPEIPIAGCHRGREAVAQFFARVGQLEDIQLFEPLEFIGEGDLVAVVGREKLTVKATGRSFEGAWAHVYRFCDGKAVQVRLFADTAGAARAFLGS